MECLKCGFPSPLFITFSFPFDSVQQCLLFSFFFKKEIEKPEVEGPVMKEMTVEIVGLEGARVVVWNEETQEELNMKVARPELLKEATELFLESVQIHSYDGNTIQAFLKE